MKNPSDRRKEADSSSPSPAVRDGPLPPTRSCLVCGVDNPRGFHLRSRLRAGVVELEYTTRPADAGYVGITHGGVLATLVDEVMTWAAIVASGKPCVATTVCIHFHKPVPPGARISIRAPLPKSRKLMRVAATVSTPDRGLVAEGEGRYLRLSHPAPEVGADFVPDPSAISPDEILR